MFGPALIRSQLARIVTEGYFQKVYDADKPDDVEAWVSRGELKPESSVLDLVDRRSLGRARSAKVEAEDGDKDVKGEEEVKGEEDNEDGDAPSDNEDGGGDSDGGGTEGSVGTGSNDGSTGTGSDDSDGDEWDDLPITWWPRLQGRIVVANLGTPSRPRWVIIGLRRDPGNVKYDPEAEPEVSAFEYWQVLVMRVVKEYVRRHPYDPADRQAALATRRAVNEELARLGLTADLDNARAEANEWTSRLKAIRALSSSLRLLDQQQGATVAEALGAIKREQARRAKAAGTRIKSVVSLLPVPSY